jgi:hypothetical protein
MIFALLVTAGLTVSPVTYATDHVLLMAGAGGEPQYTQEFNSSLESIYATLIERHHYKSEHIVLLGESSTEKGRISQDVSLEDFQSKWSELIDVVKPEDTFLLILLGHGQSDFVEPKLNLKGPDLGGKTLTAMMEALPCETKNVILSFPCSGHFSELLAPIEGVSVIASCDGPRQIFHSVMNPFLVQALKDDWSDQDGDGNLTFYELFTFLSQEVDDYYDGNEFVQISNVSLEDNGDGRVTTFAEDMDAGDGDRAREYRICPAPGYVEESIKPEIEEVAKL